MTAIQAGILAYNERALIPTDNYDWDMYNSRLFRYALSESYYNNIAYRQISTFSARLKNNMGLYKHIRSLYNPVYRLVEAYTAKVYGGSLDMEDLSRGAIPVTMASDELKDALRQLWLWSNWGVQKSLYVRYGAQMGDSYLKVVDEQDKGRVRLECVHPGKIKQTETDSVGNIKKVTIEYQKQEEDDKLNVRWVTYTEKIDADSFAFFRDGKAWDFVNNKPNGPFAEYPNPYGFVPLVHVKHKDMGQASGANAYHAQMGKIDEVNDAASMLSDQVRKSVNLIWYYAGVQKKAELVASTEEKDQIPAIYGPKDSTPTPMVGNVDLAAAGANIDRLLQELERDMPELALHRMREGGNLTAPGVRSAYSDAIDRFTEAQGNYDDGLIRAHKMAVTIGGMRRYENFLPFDQRSYANGDLDHFINERPIVQDEISKIEKITALSNNKAPIWLILRELDYDQETIDEVKADEEQKAAQAMAISGGANNPQLPAGQGAKQLPAGEKQLAQQNGKPPVDNKNLQSIWERVGAGAKPQPAAA